MPRTIQIHPLSLLVGVGIALLGVVAMAQMPAAKRPAAAHDSGQLQVAHPRDWVVVQEGQPYSVPTGRILVLTALGSTLESSASNGDLVRLLIDGQVQVHGQIYIIGGESPSVRAIPIGLRANSGSVVEVQQGLQSLADARAWGYLVDA